MAKGLCPSYLLQKGGAYEIIKRLQAQQANKILLQLQEGLSDKQLAKGQKHKVFEESFDAKAIYHRNFLLQKINYIHNNPVRGKCPPDRTGREIS